MSEKKRILQISKYYWPEVGGIEKIAEAVTKSLIDDYECKILCFTREKEDKDEFIDGVEVIRCGSKVKVASQPISFSIVKRMKRILLDYKPDYVIIHEPNPFMTFFLMKIIDKRTKLIVYWHSDIIKQKIGEKLLRNLYIKELDRADVIIATSQNYIDGSYYLSKYKGKCKVVPNCINEEQLQIIEESHAIAQRVRQENSGKIICVGVGRVVPYKGFEYLAQVAELLGDDYVFYISGRPGPSTPIIEKMTKNINNFHLLGETTIDEQNGYLEACDIFCFPSIMRSEAFGIALAEGMYFGKPAVTFRIDGSGVNYVNKNGVTGIEVENGNVEMYANAVSSLARDLELRNKMSQMAKKRIEEHFTYNQFYINIINIIKG